MSQPTVQVVYFKKMVPMVVLNALSSFEIANGRAMTFAEFQAELQTLISGSQLTPDEYSLVNDWARDISYPTTIGNALAAPTGTQTTPTFTPVGGAYGPTQNVVITSLGADAIYYTVDGSTPTIASTLYTGAVAVAVSAVLKAIAVRAGFINSAVGSASYTIDGAQATPTFSPTSGAFEAAQSVTITSAGADTIYYTIDGSTPTTGSAVYSGAISVSSPTTLKALAVRAGYSNSAVGSATINVILSGSLFAWDFSEQSGNFTTNVVNPSTPVSVVNLIEQVFAIGWKQSAGSITFTDKFAAGPSNSNLTATRVQTGGSTGAFVLNSVVSIPSGNVTVSAWLKTNSGSDGNVTPQMITTGSPTTTWAVTGTWTRFTFTHSNAAAMTNIQFFTTANTDILIYGVQVERAASASAYSVPAFALTFGATGLGGGDFPTWSGNKTITATNAQAAIAINDMDTTLATGTFYVAIKSSTPTPQQYGFTLQCPNAIGSGVPSRLELQSSWWNAPANNPTPAGGNRSFDPFLDEGGSGGLSKEFPSGNLYDERWHVCAFTFDGIDLHLYIDGVLVDSPVAAPVSGTPRSIPFDVLSLGSAKQGSSLNFPGSYAYVSGYANVIHNYAQIKQQTTTIAQLMTQNSLTPVGLQSGILVTEGDSITDGIGNAAGCGHPWLLGNNYGITWVDYGHSGDQIAQLNARATSLDALIDTSKAYNILVVNIGRNDLDHVSVLTYTASLIAYWQARVAAGWTVIASTLLPTTGAIAGPLIATANAAIRANWASAGCAALADWGGDSILSGAASNTKYLWDGTHPTALAYTLMAPYAIAAINNLSGGKPAQPSNASPTFSSLSTASGSHTGGTATTITGTGFLIGGLVTVGGTPAIITNTSGRANVTSTTIAITTPAGTVGPADVVITNLDGKAVTAAGAYTYT